MQYKISSQNCRPTEPPDPIQDTSSYKCLLSLAFWWKWVRMVTDRPPRLQKKYDTRQQKQIVKPKGEQIFQNKILPLGMSVQKNKLLVSKWIYQYMVSTFKWSFVLFDCNLLRKSQKIIISIITIIGRSEIHQGTGASQGKFQILTNR